jgi:signal transduction histidine kinase
MKLYEENVDILNVATNATNIIRPMAHKGKVELILEMQDGLPYVFADSTKLQQILINILSNAVKFTSAGGTVRLKITRDDSGALVFQVADTGIGIPADKMETVLAPFGQVDTRLARKYDGVGLGLPLTKRLIELHGGRMTIESELKHGTVVTVCFPRERFVVDTKKRAVSR